MSRINTSESSRPTLFPYKHILLIANPASCNGRTKHLIDQIAARMKDVLLGAQSIEVVQTSYPGHALEIACQLQDIDCVCVLGGDGIAHEVVNGLMRLSNESRPCFAVISNGSGNDFARSIGMPHLAQACVDALMHAQETRVDLGLCNGHYYLETISFGIDAAIAEQSVELRKKTNLAGAALYAAAGFDQLKNHRETYTVHLSVDGAPALDAHVHLLAVQNGKTYGGGFCIAPDANIADGILDACWVDGPQSFVPALRTFLMAKHGKHVNRPGVHFLSGRTFDLAFEQTPPVQIDGEYFEGSRFSISVAPSALRVLKVSQIA